jgi:hypothetical protein
MYTLTIGNKQTGSHSVTSYHSEEEALRNFKAAQGTVNSMRYTPARYLILRRDGKVILQGD